jgi:hypothetical protein
MTDSELLDLWTGRLREMSEDERRALRVALAFFDKRSTPQEAIDRLAVSEEWKELMARRAT